MAAKIIPVPTKAVPLLFPHRGVDTTQAFGLQPPLTTAAAQNVRSLGALTMRRRGGTRAMLAKYITQQLPPSSLIQELQTCVISSALFNGGSAIAFVQVADISYAFGATSAPTITMSVKAGDFLCAFFATSTAHLPGTVFDTQSNPWTQGSAFSNGNFITQNWYTFATQTGTVTITFQTGANNCTYRVTVAEYSGVKTVTPIDSHAGNNIGAAGTVSVSVPISGALHMAIACFTEADGTHAFTPGADGFTTRLSDDGSDSSGLGTLIRDYVGISATTTVSAATTAPNGAVVNTVAVFPGTSNVQSSASSRVIILVAVSGGNVYTANAGATTWITCSNNSGRTPALHWNAGAPLPIRSAQNGSYLYFADQTGAVRLNLQAANVEAWTASAGSIPSDQGNYCRLICTWRGRTVLAGLITLPQVVYFSKVDDPTDWNYLPNQKDGTEAVELASGAHPEGYIGDAVTALVPYSDDILYIGGDHTLWMVQGDPASGGVALLVSDAIGMAWGAPWCKGPDGTLYFFSNRTGIFAVTPGAKPVRLSQAIDSSLVGVDTGGATIRLAWNDRYRGLHVFITQTGAQGATTHYFWEQEQNAWWPDVFGSTAQNPVCLTVFDGNNPGDRVVLIGSWDGYVRAFSPTATSDDGVNLASFVWLGPMVTQELDKMFLKDLQMTMATNDVMTTDLGYEVYVGTSAEAALASSAVITGTFFPGRNANYPVLRSGHAIYVRMFTNSGGWEMDQARLFINTRGRIQQRAAKG